MSETQSQFDRFVAAVHRRMVVLRGLERVGLCVLGGCVLSLALMPVLIWRGQQGAGEFATVVLGAAALAGLGWAIAARPTRMAAAAAADRQLRLSDLLGTALMLRRRPLGAGAADGFERVVLALAEARCAAASPSAVVLHRLGARGWGGIGLAGAMVLGLSLMGGDGDGNRAEARATTAGGPRTWQEVEAARERDDRGNAARFAAAPDLRRVKPGTGADDADPLKAATPQDGDAAAGAGATKAGANDGAGAQDGWGGGAAQSTAKGATGAAADPTGGGAKNGAGGDTASAGGGTAGDGGGVDNGTGGGAAGAPDAKVRRPAPVWRGQGWAADQEAARAAIRSGAVPDAYRGLVREYFERE